MFKIYVAVLTKVCDGHTLKGLFMVQTVWPGVPVRATAGAAFKHLNSVPQYLENVLNITVIIFIITDAHLSLVSILAVTVPLTGESH